MATVSEDGEVAIERSGPLETEPLHQRETGSVDDREILIGIGLADGPSRFQIRRGHGFYDCDARSEPLPEALRDIPAKPVPQELPGFHENMVRRDEAITSGEDLGRSAVA